ncbi:hypothetical protein VNO77_03381 [Canavalia gladiata]|uniref:Uncharacterized protein n=1 Tax=Canavalia gladiata TaxID=3824 RepID=A0AAN9MWM5_CANGL
MVILHPSMVQLFVPMKHVKQFELRQDIKRISGRFWVMAEFPYRLAQIASILQREHGKLRNQRTAGALWNLVHGVVAGTLHVPLRPGSKLTRIVFAKSIVITTARPGEVLSHSSWKHDAEASSMTPEPTLERSHSLSRILRPIRPITRAKAKRLQTEVETLLGLQETHS